MGKRKINKRYGAQRNYPQYPTKLEVLADPQLLLRSLPVAWRNNPYIVRALVSLMAANAVALAACEYDTSTDGGDTGGIGGIVEDGNNEEAILLGEVQVYELLQSEFLENGIQLKIEQFASFPDKIRPDLSNQSGDVFAEYVSGRDYVEFGTGRYTDPSRFDDIDEVSKKVADTFSSAFTEASTLVVTEPLVYNYYTDDEICFLQNSTGPVHCQPTVEQVPHDLAREILKQQVADFIDWLKAQGIL